MTDSQAQTPAQKAIGDFAPKLVSLTDDVLFGDVWERPELSKRDRSLVRVAALITNGSTEQLRTVRRSGTQATLLLDPSWPSPEAARKAP
jgi:4-carboxymuconolactone decarboxylase